jgi:hypothetical protein
MIPRKLKEIKERRIEQHQNKGDVMGKKSANLAIVLASLGSLLALSNWWVVRENHRLRGEVDSLEAFLHTPVGVKLPPLRGKGL